MEKLKHPERKTGENWSARRLGYLITIIILFVILYILENLYEWGVPYITEDYNYLLHFIKVSFYASIIAHAILLVYDPKWFQHLLKAVTGAFSTLVVIMAYVVFPFDFPGTGNRIGKIVLVVILIISIVSIFVELIKTVRYLVKERD